MSTSTPIPTAFIVPVIEGYAQGIRPAFAYILISAMFGSLLVPLLLLVLALSSAQNRRRPTFILAIVASGLSVHLTVQGVLLPFANINVVEGEIHTFAG
ncbi:hypothetical protein GGX14DRAFT_568948 [Mycena pura]|uniref:Uncharacterized protein n=1 Tax=Mycena pura TaxID=153505 RepID=A0AAD6VA11_9AGAR|nr:hypothetical protein GGX14DRAFT_568948 [Mycena pura]